MIDRVASVRSGSSARERESATAVRWRPPPARIDLTQSYDRDVQRSIGGRSGDPAGQLGEFDPVGCAGLVQEVGDVDADGLLADHQLAGDLAVGAPGDDVGEDLPLAGGEAGKAGRVSAAGSRGSRSTTSGRYAPAPRSSASSGAASKSMASSCARRSPRPRVAGGPVLQQRLRGPPPRVGLVPGQLRVAAGLGGVLPGCGGGRVGLAAQHLGVVQRLHGAQLQLVHRPRTVRRR